MCELCWLSSLSVALDPHCWQVLETLPFSALLAVFALVYLASVLWLGMLVYIAELPTPASRLPSLPTPEGLLLSLL